MSYGVYVKRVLSVSKHPNADLLDIVTVDGYQCITKRGEYASGDLVVYIPEQSILPDSLLQAIGLWDAEKGKGRLAGADGRRLVAVRLRGVVSQGLCMKPQDGWVDGDEVSSKCGITKWVEPVPVHLGGEVFSVGMDNTVAFDVDNIKSFTGMFSGKMVIVMEKLHGTFCGITLMPQGQTHPEAFGQSKRVLIYSKGLGGKGLVFKNNEANKGNLYVLAVSKYIDKIEAMFPQNEHHVHILGEVVGKGVQDLFYTEKPEFFLFATGFGDRSNVLFNDFHETVSIANCVGVNTAPVLIPCGEYSYQGVLAVTDGITEIGTKHIREGVVVWSQNGDNKPLKSISNNYLLRRGGTEWN